MAQETQPITYQQLLADVFDENARNRLVDAQEYEEEEVDPYDIDKYSENEVDDHEDFNKFQGDLNTPEHVIKVAPAVGGTTTYGYNKDVRTTVVNIDGKFRDTTSVAAARLTYSQCVAGASVTNAFGETSATEFLVGLARQYKNVTSVKVVTMEFENSFNAFSSLVTQVDGTIMGRENTTFVLIYYIPSPIVDYNTSIDTVTLTSTTNSLTLSWNDYNVASRTISIATAADPTTLLKSGITDSGADLQYWTFPVSPYTNPYSFSISNLSKPGPYVVTLTVTNSQGSSVAVANGITIPDGNYALSGTNGLIPTILSSIQSVLTPLPSGWTFTNLGITQNPFSQKLTIAWDHLFELQFPQTTDCFTQNGIGYNLGFYNTSVAYTSSTSGNGVIVYKSSTGIYSATGDTRPDMNPDRYVYLVINDWYQIHHQYSDQTQLGAFLKVPISVAKYQVQYDNISLDTITKEYFFPLPINIQKLEISVVDSYGKLLDMNGGSFSMSLAISEVLQPGIYENLLKM